jgi:tRNA (mo5U34)-methyltransferase
MEPARTLLEKRLMNPAKAGLDATGLYHSFRLPDGSVLEGAMSLEWQLHRLESFGLPADLSGKRVLDIGPWDGFYTFEMERRGAEVTAIDYVDLDTFRALHRAFQSKADYRRMEVYELDPARIGTFDIVLCLGVLYHLKHPLLGLERVCSVTRDVCIVDTFVTDGEAWQQGVRAPLPSAEFYERGELGGQLDNWCGPTVSAVEAWLRAAGFASTEIRKVIPGNACVAARRRWRDLPAEEKPAPAALGLNLHESRGRTFCSAREQYIVFWCAWGGEPTPPVDSVFPEVDGFGVVPLACIASDGALVISFRLPPGLAPGGHSARMKIGDRAWTEACSFYVDLPDIAGPITVGNVQDGVTWQNGAVDWNNGGWITLWVEGLSPEADPGNTSVVVDGIPHEPSMVSPSNGQINVKLRPVVQPGHRDVYVTHRGASSPPVLVRIAGDQPPVRGVGKT